MSRDRGREQGHWQVTAEALGRDRERLSITSHGQPMRWRDILSAWRHDDGFADWFGNCLVAAPFDALRWETPPLVSSGLERPFECVLLDAPELRRPADPAAFSSYLDTRCDVVRFDNLGGDAELVVPTPIADDEAYPHLTAFLQYAPCSQQRALWRSVAEAMNARIGDKPVWLNTAGAGVPWLHVRLDDRPKYYGHAPYRNASP